MLTIYAELQDPDVDGGCWNLKYNGRPLAEVAKELGISKGDRVVLDPLEDFVVTGTLDFKFVQMLNREGWVAYPDWTTRKETQ